MSEQFEKATVALQILEIIPTPDLVEALKALQGQATSFLLSYLQEIPSPNN